MDELVQKLSQGDHPVVTQRYKTSEELKQAIDRDYVLVKFTDTRGGTELGVKLDKQLSDWGKADFAKASGKVHLAGDLTLNYVKVRCVADVDLATLAGQGHLEIRE
ncbi:MAG: MbtH domain protein [Desulfobacteraceae bacterium]|nr:MAG: MbtH domain protein [Desulfobacteraceae bacterium]